jgi:hypothetical protein
MNHYVTFKERKENHLIYLQLEILTDTSTMEEISIISAYNTDCSLLGSASNLDFILTLGFFVCNPSGYIISGKEQTVLLRVG